MPDQLSHFDEKSGTVRCPTPWGNWWQTVQEVHIEVNLPPNSKSREIDVNLEPKSIEVLVRKELVFKGTLFQAIHVDDSVWTIEDRCLLDIVLSKSNTFKQDEIWESLMEDGCYKPDPLVFHEMRKKLDLERFQLENPGFDFSQAKLQKCYDKPPV
ncbi:NudC domain-containing protein 2 [Frankliniella fusca]|uniref:NudC domain-containing protein 2 n=1 Tax=Frankliniella fusca TaxID=407009 RepID=A0AAE1GZS8_9NEOP|nr:NudC domain-containing protein 2 [Frankliniella fusca]